MPKRLRKALPFLLIMMMSAQAQADRSTVGQLQMAEVERGGTLPSLPHLLSLALTNDSELARQRYRLQASREDVPMAWARLQPRISTKLGYAYQRSENIYTDNPERYPDEVYEERISGVTNDHYWQVSLSQPLFNLERWREVHRAREEVDAAVLEVAVAEQELALQVVDAYLNAFLASRQQRLLDSKREALELQQRQAQRAYDLGLGDRINVMEARARLDQTVADQVEVENDLDDALSEIQRLTGRRPDFTDFAVGDLVAVGLGRPEPAEPAAWLARVGANIRVKLARQQYRAAQAATSVNQASRYPDLDLNLSYGDRDSSDVLRRSEDLTASVELSADLYRGGLTTARIRQSEWSALARREAMTNELRLARVEIQKRLRNLQGGRRRLEALSRSIESSGLFLDAAIKGEDLGLRDLVDVLDARADLYDQRTQFVEVICRFIGDKLDLEAAVGDLDTNDLREAMSLLRAMSHTAS